MSDSQRAWEEVFALSRRVLDARLLVYGLRDTHPGITVAERQYVAVIPGPDGTEQTIFDGDPVRFAERVAAALDSEAS